MTVDGLHAQYAEFVFRSLLQLGAWGPDVDDLQQRVWLVVLQKLPSFDQSRSLRPWLFYICQNVFGNYRKATARKFAKTVYDADVEVCVDGGDVDPEEQLARKEARRELYEILDELDEYKRIVLVMYEIDEIPCKEIAEILDIPVGTVHSRLYAARAAFEKALARRTQGGNSR